jgi:hypothetical protein
LSAAPSISLLSRYARTGCGAPSRPRVQLPSEKLLRRLEDILENIARIEQFTAGMNFDGFAANELAVYASLHALLIVSEAAT